MKRKLHYFLLTALLFLSVGVLQAQDFTVSGKVTDGTDGSGLPGVSIVVKGTQTGTITDFDGNYTIKATKESVLIYTFIGYSPKEVTVTGQTHNVVLEVDAKALEEVVVVGYGTMKKKVVTGAVTNVSSEDITKTQSANVGAALQGQIAGVNIQAASGSPGEDANIQIRGLGSLSANSLGPLFVVDGIPYDGNPNIAPEQIESIDVLKDGASAAIYGVRASNGVILITTKKGKEGKMNVELSTYQGIQDITSGTPLMDTHQQLYFDEIRTAALGQKPSAIATNPSALENNTDFVDEILNSTAMVSNYNINVSGGTKTLTLNANVNYFNQEGVLINSGFDRLSSRLTGQFTKGKFKAFASFGYTQQTTETEPWGLYEMAMRQPPWNTPIADLPSTGDGVLIPDQNDITYSYLSRILENTDVREVNRFNVAFNASYEFLKGLSYNVRVGYNSFQENRTRFAPRYIVYNAQGSYSPSASIPQAVLQEDNQWRSRGVLENMLSYKKTFGDHELSAKAVLSYEKYTNKEVGYSGQMPETMSNDIKSPGALESVSTPTSFDDVSTLTGKLLRVDYNFAGRYMLSASVRHDGSSKFSKDNRYQTFPSASIGWNAHEESFFNIPKVNSLKVRVSMAEVGNNSIRSYATVNTIESGVNYPFGYSEDLNTGLIQRRLVDPNIKWETTNETNFGIDLGMFDNRLQITADYYIRNKTDMLLSESIPLSGGTYVTDAAGTYGVRVINGGDMVNRGLEIMTSYRDKTKFGLKYNISATFSKNYNEVTDLNGIDRGYGNGRPIQSLSSIDHTTFLANGYEAGAFFLVETDGLITTPEELEEYQQIDQDAKLGDLRYIDQLTEDTDGDGIPDAGNGKIDDNDRVYKGSGMPTFSAGLNINLEYKNFDLFVKAYYSYGAKIYNGAKLFAYTVGRHEDLYSMWTPQNPTSEVPTYRNMTHNNIRAHSDRFLEDGTYLRINTITLGYNFGMLKKFGIEKARIYLSSVNPFTFTKYTGYDPEVGGDGLFTRGVDRGNYPVSRQFQIGAQLKF